LELVIWADCLHSWHYSSKYDPPATVDYTRAAIVFWGALLTPMLIGLIMSVVAFRRDYPARWPIGEMIISASPWLMIYVPVFRASILYGPSGDSFLSAGNIILGGIIVMTLLNLGASARHRKWGKFALSAMASLGGILYLLWLYTVIIYLDT
jgi:hypothetical protein